MESLPFPFYLLWLYFTGQKEYRIGIFLQEFYEFI